jgi:lipopolysaccharide/colanic/teichoic acid biosynthesis glycosyltransferase
MPKFRTMHVDAPAIATHLLENPIKYLTPFGRSLRRFTLDELPQLWSVLKGDMSFVGVKGWIMSLAAGFFRIMMGRGDVYRCFFCGRSLLPGSRGYRHEFHK